jgi:hypothetical protein
MQRRDKLILKKYSSDGREEVVENKILARLAPVNAI